VAEVIMNSSKTFDGILIYSEKKIIGGNRIMAEMKKIIYKEADERLMVGMFRETSFSNAGQAW